MVRVLPSHGRGPGFEPLSEYQKIIPGIILSDSGVLYYRASEYYLFLKIDSICLFQLNTPKRCSVYIVCFVSGLTTATNAMS